jgi:Glyoxalase-like domain
VSCELDHLVLAARTLDEGVAWCERTLGITPAAGGRHALMGTHNRVFSIASDAFPRAYFEIIAIDPEAPAPGRARWFDLDDPRLQAAIADGPRLVHWVARCSNLDATLATLARRGIDAGRVLDASRATPAGELRWRIAVPDDGARRLRGALPLLIAWGAMHPADSLPPSSVTLQSLALDAGGDDDALHALGLERYPRGTGAPLSATLASPRGTVALTSIGGLSP